MQRRSTSAAEPDGIVDLLRETVDGLGHLIAEHVNLAKLELAADVKQLARRGALAVVVLPVLMVGYVFLWLGGAVALGRSIGTAEALAIVGGVHLVAGGVALLALRSRLRRQRVRLMDETASEFRETFAALAATAPRGETEAAASPMSPRPPMGRAASNAFRSPRYTGGVGASR